MWQSVFAAVVAAVVVAIAVAVVFVVVAVASGAAEVQRTSHMEFGPGNMVDFHVERDWKASVAALVELMAVVLHKD